MSYQQFLEKVGEPFTEKFAEFKEFLVFAVESFRQFIIFYRERQVAGIVLVRQILFTGFEALRLVVLIGISIGFIIILEGHLILGTFGQSQLVYTILVSVIVRELASLLTAIIIIARSGTAISTELGNMVLNHEVEALQSIGISPISYLVIPRVFGVVVSLVTLSIYFNIAGLFAGWLISTVFYPIGFEEYITGLLNELSVMDIILSILKAGIFGVVIGLIACFNGLKVLFASTEVPQRMIKTVVQSLSWVIIIDIFLTTIFYMFL